MTPEELARDAIRVIDRVEEQQIQTLNRLITSVQNDFLELAKAIDFTENDESRAIKQLRISSVIEQSKAAIDLLSIGKPNSEAEQQLRANVIASYQEGLDSSQRAVMDTGILTPEQIDKVTTFAPRVEMEYIDAVTRTTLTTLEKVSERTLDRLEEELVRASVRGAGPAAAARSIRETFNLTRNESERISRTVFMSANNTARMSQFAALGLNYLQYTAANDERTCEYCEARHGMVYKIDDSPDVPTHPNCRCVLLPWSPESAPENRGDAYYEVTRQEMRERREEEGKSGTTATARAPFERANGVDAPEPVWAPGRGFLDRDEEVLPATSVEIEDTSIEDAALAVANLKDHPDRQEALQAIELALQKENEAKDAVKFAELDFKAKQNLTFNAQNDLFALKRQYFPDEPPEDLLKAANERVEKTREVLEKSRLERNEAWDKEASAKQNTKAAEEERNVIDRRLASAIISNEATGDRLGDSIVVEMQNRIPKEKQAQAQEANQWLRENTVLTNDLDPIKIRHSTKHAAFYDPNTREVVVGNGFGTKTWAHEFMHAIEDRNPIITAANTEFKERRTANEPVVSLRTLTQENYDPKIRVQPDNFIMPYTGRVYRDGGTEIASTGLEMMFRNPVEFAVNDPDHFDFTLRLMKGKL